MYFNTCVVNPDDPTQCKIYAPDQRGWFTMRTRILRQILFDRGATSFNALASIRHSVADGAKGDNGPTKGPQEEGETTDSIEDLLHQPWAGIWALPATGDDPEDPRYEFYVGDNMGSIERRIKLAPLGEYGRMTTGCAMNSLLNAAAAPVLHDAGRKPFLIYAAKAAVIANPYLRNNASVNNLTDIVNRTGVLELRRLRGDSEAFGDPAAIADPQRLLERCCATARTAIVGLGTGVGLAGCELTGGLFGHHITINLEDGYFADAAEAQTYPLTVEALEEKGIVGFCDLRFFHFSGGADISTKAYRRLELWKDMVRRDERLREIDGAVEDLRCTFSTDMDPRNWGTSTHGVNSAGGRPLCGLSEEYPDSEGPAWKRLRDSPPARL